MVDASALIRPVIPKRVLRIEGPDDHGVMVALLHYLGFSRNEVEAKVSGGINELLKHVPVDLKESELGRFGIVVDADSDARARWDALRGVLAKSGYAKLPKTPAKSGTILSEVGLPTVGIWVMPDNATPGAVAHFARQLVPAGDVLLPHAETTIQQVITLDRRFGPTHELKATIHTWLAWQSDPGRPMGQAITKRFLEPTSPAANAICSWLRTLFTL